MIKYTIIVNRTYVTETKFVKMERHMGTQQVWSFTGGEDRDSTRDNEVSDNDGRKSNK